jgi:hypothetical protein
MTALRLPASTTMAADIRYDFWQFYATVPGSITDAGSQPPRRRSAAVGFFSGCRSVSPWYIFTMAGGSPTKRQIKLRLVHNGVQPGTPLAEPLRFGLQDSKGEVHPGVAKPGQSIHFDLALDVGESGDAGQPVFKGVFAHGPPTARFLYLSWKREGKHDAPWGWRIKIPLSGIGWPEIRAAEKPGKCLAANVTGRRPHATDAITWRLGETSENS